MKLLKSYPFVILGYQTKLMKQLPLLILATFLFTSCGKIYLKMMGVKEFKPVEKTEIVCYFNKINLDTSCILALDSIKYKTLIHQKLKDSSVYTSPNWWVQNHVQPTQVIYYNLETQKSIAAYFNCIAESRAITNLTYNKYNELEFFPPLTYTDSRWIDTLFTMQEIVGTIQNLGTNQPYQFTPSSQKYLALIFYSLAIEKQSTNIIRESREHINKCIQDSCQVLYINMDNYLYSETN